MAEEQDLLENHLAKMVFQHKLNVQAYLVYYLDACARLGKVPNELETYLPWNLPETVRKDLKLRETKK